MKKYLFLFFAIQFSWVSAQTNPYFVSNATPVLYRGVYNVLYLKSCENTDPIRVTCKKENVDISTEDNSKYIIRIKNNYNSPEELLEELENLPPKKDALPYGIIELKIQSSEKTTYQRFRVKQIPDPSLWLGNYRPGNIKAEKFRVQKGLIAVLENLDFDARCTVKSFSILRISKQGKRFFLENGGPKFKEETTVLVENAQAEDIYLFDNIKCKCPGDGTARNLDSIIFHIK